MTRRGAARVVVLLAVLALFLGGWTGVSAGDGAAAGRTAAAGSSSSTSTRPLPPRPPEARVPRARYVVAVSIDGLSRRAVRRLGRQGTPALHRLMRQGRATLNARTAREITVTLPNHTGMMTGRRLRTERGHHVTFNEDDGRTLRSLNGHYVPGVFDVVHDHGGSTALYTSKDKFRFLDRSWNARNGRRDRVGADDGRDKIDRFLLDHDPAVVVDALVRRLRNRPHTLSFLHLTPPDAAGHEHGWMSPEYLAAVRRSDALLGRVLDVVRGSRHLRRHVDVVLTADHGGVPGETSHSDARHRQNFRIPFVVWGVDVRSSGSLYSVNRNRRNPGPRRTTYSGRQPIRNMDVADLVTSLLGLPPVPGGQKDLRPLRVS